MDGVELAKMIRKDLKQAFPKQKFSIRNQRGGYSTAINVGWNDGVAQSKVKPILQKFERIDRDYATQEILAGGNTFIFDERGISEKNRERVRKKIEKKANFSPAFNEYEKQSIIGKRVWEKLRETSF